MVSSNMALREVRGFAPQIRRGQWDLQCKFIPRKDVAESF